MRETINDGPVNMGIGRIATILAVYLGGFLQGIALIIFPAAGALFTDPEFHGLGNAQFGWLFTPQIVGAIVTSLSAASLARRFSMKWVLLVGMLCNIVSMSLMAVSHVLFGTGIAVYLMLLLGTGFVGAGFGLTISALNAYAFDLFRDRADAAVTGLHVLAGAGQSSASIILNLFLSTGIWWGAPTMVAGLLVVMLLFQSRLTLRLSTEDTADQAHAGKSAQGGLPLRIWLYGLVVFLYGACEATFGNWSTIYLEDNAGLAAAQAAQALAVFWGMVTLGRVLFALAAVWFKPQFLYLIAPFVVAGALIGLPLVSGVVPSMLMLALAGLGLSFFFPLTISIASAEQPDKVPAVSGTMVGGIQLGVGISSIIVGQAAAFISLPDIFQFSSGYALLMGAIVIYLWVTKTTRSAAT